MFFTTIIGTAFVSFATCQYQMAYPDSNAPTQASVQKSTYPAAPLHYVQIGPQLTGGYKFGYDTGKGPLGQSFREEIRLADGTVSGTYGVVDELGHKRVVHYSAGKSTTRAQKDRIPKRIADSIPSSPPPPQNRYVENPDTNLVPPPRYTSPLVSWKLENRLQPKPSMAPLYTYAEESMQQMAIATPHSSAFGLPAPPTQARDETTRSMLDYYHASNVHRSGIAQALDFEASKIPRSAKSLEFERKEHQKPVVQMYDPKVEDEYYDALPAFIDIGRLSYNIGTDSKASVKF